MADAERAEEIAEKLTGAQARMIARRSVDWFDVRYADMRVLPAPNRLGLISRASDGDAMLMLNGKVFLNSTGVEVRRILEQKEAGHV